MNKKLTIIVLIVLAVIIIALLGVLLFVPKPQTQNNDTADWKTYKNDQYGFEFKYPSNTSVVDTSNGGGFVAAELQLIILNSPQVPEDYNTFTDSWLFIDVYKKGLIPEIDKATSDANLKVINNDQFIVRMSRVNRDKQTHDFFDKIAPTFKFTK